MFDSRMKATFLAGLPEALHGVDFPASRDDIVEMAQINDAATVLVDRLKDLPERDFDNLADLHRELGIEA